MNYQFFITLKKRVFLVTEIPKIYNMKTRESFGPAKVCLFYFSKNAERFSYQAFRTQGHKRNLIFAT